MPRYVVMKRRDTHGTAKSALDAVSNEAGVSIISADNPDVVTIETTEATAKRLRATLQGTHHVEPEVRRSLE